jgi:hypothetical protein
MQLLELMLRGGTKKWRILETTMTKWTHPQVVLHCVMHNCLIELATMLDMCLSLGLIGPNLG